MQRPQGSTALFRCAAPEEEGEEGGGGGEKQIGTQEKKEGGIRDSENSG